VYGCDAQARELSILQKIGPCKGRSDLATLETKLRKSWGFHFPLPLTFVKNLVKADFRGLHDEGLG
jgi:hypothetical protein